MSNQKNITLATTPNYYIIIMLFICFNIKTFWRIMEGVKTLRSSTPHFQRVFFYTTYVIIFFFNFTLNMLYTSLDKENEIK